MRLRKKYCMTTAFKIFIAQFMLNFIGLIVGYTWAINIENKKWSGLIYKDIKIADFDLGGKTKEEAKNIIKSQYIEGVLKKKLYVTVDDKVYSALNSTLIKCYDVDNAIDNAFNFGKNLNIIQKHKLIKNGSFKEYKLDFTCNDKFIKEFTESIEKQVNKEPVNATMQMKLEGTIKIDADTKGYKLEKEKLEEYIQSKIKDGVNEDIYIKAPIEQTEATITEAKLSSIHTNIASFSTSFETSSDMRCNNVDVSVKAINGTLLVPGEVFSFNKKVGERTKERGYMEAPVIIGNKVESGIGGGICQVSSTLYNAVLRAGIQPIERTHHSLPSAYVALGLDATVDWENIDFKFKNTFNYPIYIEGYTENKKLYINIFSNSSLNKRKYVVENNIYEVLSSTNANMYEVNDGYKVKVMRKTYENEAMINSEVISDDVYTTLVSSKLR